MANANLKVNLNIEELPAVKATIERLQAERDEALRQVAEIARHVDRLEACLRDRDCGGQPAGSVIADLPLGGIVADIRDAVDGEER